MSRRGISFAALLPFVASVACGSGETAERAVVWDSAGVVIVESHGPAWVDASAWQLDREPLLQIGLADGPEEYQFSQVAAVIRTPDDRVLVADGGSQELRYFDLTGRFLGSVGRRGDAPGEYRRINALGWGPGDSLWVYDFGGRRFTVLDGRGEFVRSIRVGGELSNVGAVGRLRDGSFVVREYWSARAHLREVRPGLSRDPAALAKLSSDGARLDTLGLFPGREVFIGSEDGRPVMSAPLFAHGLSATVAGDEIVIGDQETFEIGVYSTDGTLTRLIRLPDVDLRLRAIDVDRLKAALMAEGSEGHRAMLRAHLESMEVPQTRPAYGDLISDSAGNLWVAEQAPDPWYPSYYRVFDSEGRLLGAVGMPPRFRLFDIGNDWLLGVWQDEIGVEYVQLYHLEKRD